MTEAVTILNEVAGERSRYRVLLEVRDLDGNVVKPSSLKWTLTDRAGTVINNRLDQVVTNPQAAHPLILYGADLQVSEGTANVERVLLIEATYTEGGTAGMPYNHEYRFLIRNYVGISDSQSSEQLLDADGNPITDADGNPITAG